MPQKRKRRAKRHSIKLESAIVDDVVAKRPTSHRIYRPYMGSYVVQTIYGNHIRVSNHMWRGVSNHIPTIFDHIWVFIWSLSLTTYGVIYDIKTNHIPTCRQIICQIIYDFKTIYGFDSNHIWLKSNHIWKSIKSYMILNHMWNHIWYWKWIICKIIYREIICQIIYAKSYTTEAYMVPCMIHHVVSYTCVSKYIYLPYVATIYEIICGIIYELFRTICNLKLAITSNILESVNSSKRYGSMTTMVAHFVHLA